MTKKRTRANKEKSSKCQQTTDDLVLFFFAHHLFAMSFKRTVMQASFPELWDSESLFRFTLTLPLVRLKLVEGDRQGIGSKSVSNVRASYVEI